jgi:hypothetical protein
MRGRSRGRRRSRIAPSLAQDGAEDEEGELVIQMLAMS